jgi:hypothetical protein
MAAMVEQLSGAREKNILLGLCWGDKKLVKEIVDQIEARHFSTRHYQKIADIAISHYRRYTTAIRTCLPDYLEDELRKSDGEMYEIAIREMQEARDEIQVEFVRSELTNYVAHREMTRSVELASDALHADDIDAAGKLLEQGRMARHATGRETLITVRLDQVKFKKTKWLWYGRVPMGMVSIISGEGGIGKTLIGYNIAAAVTQGWSLPDKEGRTLPGVLDTPADVLLLSGHEEPLEQVTKWRLDLAGADMSRIHYLKKLQAPDGQTMGWSLANVEAVRNYLIKYPDIMLVTVDPMMSFFPGSMKNNYSGVEVRALMDPWSELAAEFNVAVIFVNHFNKGSGKATDRNSGSHAIVDAARLAHIVTKDKEKDTFVFIQMKGNIGKPLPGLRYKMEDDEVTRDGITNTVSKLVWFGASNAESADDALSLSGARAAKSEKIVEWLRDFLKDGPRPQRIIMADGLQKGYSDHSIRKAKTMLGVMSDKGRGPDAEWIWCIAEPGERKR